MCVGGNEWAHGICVFQRYNSTEQAYSEIHNKYTEVMSLKAQLEKQRLQLQSQLENAHSEKSHYYEQISQLESKHMIWMSAFQFDINQIYQVLLESAVLNC